MGERFDLLLVELPDGGAAGVLTPYMAAEVGDLVETAAGIGKVVGKLDFLEKTSPVLAFVSQVLDIQDAVAVWNLNYERRDQDGTEELE